jgi:hypothetical protein
VARTLDLPTDGNGAADDLIRYRRGRRSLLDEGPLFREQGTSILRGLMPAFEPTADVGWGRIFGLDRRESYRELRLELLCGGTVQAEELLRMNECIHGERTAFELQDRVTELIEQQTAISEVLRAIANSPYDLQPIFDAILDSATRLCRADIGGLLRPIPVEHDPDHDHRADCDHHRADHGQLFEHGDNARPPAKSSLHMRETPACHTHSETPFGPQQRWSLSTQSARLTIANSGVPSDQGKEPAASRLRPR